jgi:hypothetical protein
VPQNNAVGCARDRTKIFANSCVGRETEFLNSIGRKPPVAEAEVE